MARDMLTDRLRLVPVTSELKTAMASSLEAFAALIGARLPAEWPQFPEAFSVGGRESSPPWTGYIFLARDEPWLIGNGGFVAEPDAERTVEIGYEVAPRFWNRGYATEAAVAMIDQAFEAGARSVIAHSLAETNASNTVMRKLGMRFDGETKSGELTVWRWRTQRVEKANRGSESAP
jgi:RimJ/RimL family protein N-acetyltransferase